MPPPLDPDKRAAILAAIRAGGKRNDIAREFKVGAGTVTKIAQDEGLSFDRSDTEAATRAKQADNKTRRAQLASDLLDDAQRLRERAWTSYSWYERTREDVIKVTAEQPPLGDVRNAYAAIGIALDKHAVLERLDSDTGAAEARSMLGSLAGALQVAVQQLDQTTTTEGGSDG